MTDWSRVCLATRLSRIRKVKVTIACRESPRYRSQYRETAGAAKAQHGEGLIALIPVSQPNRRGRRKLAVAPGSCLAEVLSTPPPCSGSFPAGPGACVRETDGHLHCAGLRPIAYGLNGDCLRQVSCYGNGVLVVVGGRESRSHSCRGVGDTSGAGEGGQVACVQTAEVCVMQRAEVVLGALRKRAERAPVAYRLYRHLFNPELYGDAGSDPGEVHGIIRLLRAESYHPGPRSDSHRRDGLVEQVLGRLLAAVFQLDWPRLEDGEARQGLLAALRGMQPARWVLVGEVGDVPATWSEEAVCETLGKRVRDGRLLELCRRFFRAYGHRSMPVKVCLELRLTAVDRLVGTLAEVAGYARLGSSFIIASHDRPGRLREALDGLPGIRLELLDMSRAGRRIMGYQVVRGPSSFRLRVPAGGVRERLQGFVRGNRAVRRPDRLGMTAEAMIALYRAELVRVAAEYDLAEGGLRHLARFRHYHLGSLLLTLASKERSSVRTAVTRYRMMRDGRSTIGKSTPAGTVSYPVITRAGFVL